MIHLDGASLTIDDVVATARHRVSIAPLANAVCERMQKTHRWVNQSITDGTTIYGINTGFGPLANTQIRSEDATMLSRNVIHACIVGTGEPLSEEVTRAIMLVRANTLTSGSSGVRPVLASTLIEMLNRGVTPSIPSKGSLGASGDLAPLAHLAVVLTGDPIDRENGYSGFAWYDGQLLTGNEAMRRAGIDQVTPMAKEGLALTNGTAFMVACGCLAVSAARQMLEHSLVAAAMSMEALTAVSAAFHPELQRINRLIGQARIASRIQELIAGSDLIDSDLGRVQDAYSIRCIPQVLGPICQTIDFVHQNFSGVLNGVNDNPLIIQGEPDGGGGWQSISGGNFHGQGPAMWLDFLAIAVAEIGNIAERRIFRLVVPELNNGLPSMLVVSPGLNSGLMMLQYTAAALVSDNKTLAHPDSVDSIPSSANQEDHVSMGANAARHTLEVVENTRAIIAIEFLTAAQAIDLREEGKHRLASATRAAYDTIRRSVSFVDTDRALSPDIEAIVGLIDRREILQEVDECVS